MTDTSNSAKTSQKVNGGIVPVVYALRENAKRAKLALENAGLLDKNFRMVAAESNPEAIALPVLKENVHLDPSWKTFILGIGSQACPYSTKVMGQHKHYSSTFAPNLSLVQKAVLLTIENSPKRSNISNDAILDRMERVDSSVFPQKLEIIGDDRTVVIPPDAFDGDEFRSILHSLVEESTEGPTQDDCLVQEFWMQLANIHDSKRIVRRGRIDTNSPIRQSGHKLIFPQSGIPEETGPGSPGWIRVTEQGIKQSFDITRVMFSRGNVSEKIRFGKLVRKGESVLDMYAGIGYYTLPALICGQAERVVACEWNEFAIQALQYNIRDNGVADRVTILQGDCRQSAREHKLLDMFDRVSLGLLPSSEGGWETAVRALKQKPGGWLHIHGNVPHAEKNDWGLWVCGTLVDICDEVGRPSDWIVLCEHIEKVKSFAPNVSHFVADVFLGEADLHPRSNELGNCRAGMLLKDGCRRCDGKLSVPSCALSPNGVLSQSWMM